MKLQNALVCGLVLTSLVGGTMTTFAEEPNGKTATTKGEITFVADEDGGQPVDPEDPNKPVDPSKPINPGKGELMITYASDFNFGTQKKGETSWQAQADKMKNDELITPFVSTKDTRGTDRQGWSLTAALSKGFEDGQENELKGAELSLSNMFYSDKELNAPTASTETLTLNATGQEVAKADGTTGIGNWSVGLGKLQADNTTNGVTLNVPEKSAKNTATYTAEVTWELTADPTK